MLICLICALTGHLVQLKTKTLNFLDNTSTLDTWCRRCRHTGHHPLLP